MILLIIGSVLIYQISYHISDFFIVNQTFSKSYLIQSGILVSINYLFNILCFFCLIFTYKKTNVLENIEQFHKHKENIMSFVIVGIMLPLIFIMLSFIQGIYHMKENTEISVLVFHQTANMPLLDFSYAVGFICFSFCFLLTLKENKKELRVYPYAISDIKQQIKTEKQHIQFQKNLQEQNL